MVASTENAASTFNGYVFRLLLLGSMLLPVLGAGMAKGDNPVEIATNVVWRVSDTAKALFDVENYQEFVDIQIESAVRVIGARYPYDEFNADEVTLRGDADEVSHELEKELQERVGTAGVQIDECRLTHLAYAPEIAQSMLRRQQAEAVIAARSRLVEVR